MVGMLAQALDGRRFVAIANAHGRSGAETIFTYHVTPAGAVTGTYAGGDIAHGQLVGRVVGSDRLELLFQCRTDRGELLAGHSVGHVRRRADGRLGLHFEWAWHWGESGGGTSQYVELPEGAPAGAGT